MINKIEEIYIKKIVHVIGDIINMKIFDANRIKIVKKVLQKYSCLLLWLRKKQTKTQDTKKIKMQNLYTLLLIR